MCYQKFVYSKMLLLLCALHLCLIYESECKTIHKRGIMDNINNGIKYAGQMLGINTVADVADLVAKTFAPHSYVKRQDTDGTEAPDNSKSETNESTSSLGLINGLLRLMGFDNNKLGALAINGIIMIAQMIGNILISRRGLPSSTDSTKDSRDDQYQPRMADRQSRIDSSFNWIQENPSPDLSKILQDIKDPKIPEYLAETVTALERKQGEGDCIKLLLCKSAPFIWGMQKSVINRLDKNASTPLPEEGIENEDGQRLNAFFKYLPDVTEYKEHGKQCEDRYADCNLTTI